MEGRGRSRGRGRARGRAQTSNLEVKENTSNVLPVVIQKMPPQEGQFQDAVPSLNGGYHHAPMINGYQTPVNGYNNLTPVNGHQTTVNGYQTPVNGYQTPVNGYQTPHSSVTRTNVEKAPSMYTPPPSVSPPNYVTPPNSMQGSPSPPVTPPSSAEPPKPHYTNTALAPYKRAKRPGYGTLGYKKIPLLVNYFEIIVPEGVFHQYDVDIEHDKASFKDQNKKFPTRIPVNVTRKIFAELIRVSTIFRSHLPVYDGNKILITRRPLPITHSQSFRVTIEEDDVQRTFVVNVKPAKMKHGRDSEIQLDDFHKYMSTRSGEFPADAVKAVDLVLKYGPSLKFTPAGRAIFFKPDPNTVPDFGGGREIWFGYSQSARPTEWLPIVNIDLAATTFYKEGPVIDFVKDVLNTSDLSRPLPAYQLKTLGKEIGGLKVKVTHLPYERKYRVVGISKQSAKELTFPYTDNGRTQMVTVDWYFRNIKKKPVNYYNLPCLQMQPKEKKIYVPIEFCVLLPDQHCRKKLSENLTSLMIKKTLKTPKERFREIQKNVVLTKDVSKEYLQEFGIDINTNPMSVDGRVLNAPKIVYNSRDQFIPKEGAWNMQEHSFFKGAEIPSWAILNYGYCNKAQLDNFEKMLKQIGAKVGIQLGNLECNQDLSRERTMGVSKVLRRLREKYPLLKLVIIVLATKGQINGNSYAEIKQTADTEIGIITQCVKDINISNPKKCSPQLISNLCQKINAKMGGVNNSITAPSVKELPKVMETPCIVMGADVTHPAPGDNTPSIAAVVGSLDRHPSKFAARISVQKNSSGFQSRVEIIIELKQMVRSLLRQFLAETKKKPERIVFYRDGVSEGQFAEVCSYEINQIKLACQSLSENYKPQLTFIVVQKRHRTRFCPKNDRDGMGRAGNIPPGTTVDTKIISPVDFDFFLCSHYGMQGTSKPTHYTVLWDESDLSADDIQMLSYYLCHTYVKCTRSISIPAPVQYAHLAAFRARYHISRFTDFSSSSSGSGGYCSPSSEEFNEINQAVEIQNDLKDSMYFA